METSHLISQYRERNHFRIEDQSCTPSWQTIWPWSFFPSHITTSAWDICKASPLKSDPKDQTQGVTLSPGQHTNSFPLKTLGKSNTADRSSAASAVKGSSPVQGGETRGLSEKPSREARKMERELGGGIGRKHESLIKWGQVLPYLLFFQL